MLLKKYRTTYLKKLILGVDVKGETKIVEFGGGDLYTGRKASFSTTDSDLQAALEKSSGFGSLFILEDKLRIAEPIREREDPTAPDGVNRPYRFANFNELRDFLVKEKGKAAISVSTLEKASTAMDKLGLKFIIE